MASRFSKVKDFVLGSAGVDEPDDFAPDIDTADEVTDIVDYAATRPSSRNTKAAAPVAQVASLDERRRPVAVPSASPIEIKRSDPRSYAEAVTIGESFREGLPVVLNMTLTDESQAIKLIDFCAGMAFASGGTLEKITSRVFLLCPPACKFTETDKAELAGQHYLHG
ncbi:MAG: cell division protein SepF [Propionibacteriaceae bacterium]|nr:cell division protein SepF [Propionibacteriaceae bacterium]